MSQASSHNSSSGRSQAVPSSESSAASDLDDALHDAQQLFKAAERIIKESCGEKWLLQPSIPEMERNEYR